MVEVADAYWSGYPVARDELAARIWYRRAIDQGSLTAVDRMIPILARSTHPDDLFEGLQLALVAAGAHDQLRGDKAFATWWGPMAVAAARPPYRQVIAAFEARLPAALVLESRLRAHEWRPFERRSEFHATAWPYGALPEAGRIHSALAGSASTMAEVYRAYTRARDPVLWDDPFDPELLRLAAGGNRAAQLLTEGWFQAAAEGSARAQRWLGSIYKDGNRVPRDLDASMEWYRRAAWQDDLYAISALADDFSYGDASADPIEGLFWALVWYDRRFGRDRAPYAIRAYEARLTPAQIAEARRRAADWQPELP